MDASEINAMQMQYQQQMDMSYIPMDSSAPGSASSANPGSAPPPGSWPSYYYPPPPYYVPSAPYYTPYQRKQYQQQQYYNNINGLPRAAKSALYKTELCKNFVSTGECKYGDMCQFAHGKEQIRQVPANHRKNQQQQNADGSVIDGSSSSTEVSAVTSEEEGGVNQSGYHNNNQRIRNFHNDGRGYHKSNNGNYQRRYNNNNNNIGAPNEQNYNNGFNYTNKPYKSQQPPVNVAVDNTGVVPTSSATPSTITSSADTMPSTSS